MESDQMKQPQIKPSTSDSAPQPEKEPRIKVSLEEVLKFPKGSLSNFQVVTPEEMSKYQLVTEEEYDRLMKERPAREKEDQARR